MRAYSHVGKDLGEKEVGIKMPTPGDKPEEENSQDREKGRDDLIIGERRTKEPKRDVGQGIQKDTEVGAPQDSEVLDTDAPDDKGINKSH